MITLKLTRQQINDLLAYFFPYMVQWCDMQLRDTAAVKYYSKPHILAVVLKRTVAGVQKYFELRKLQASSDLVKCKLNSAEALLFMTVLMEVPVSQDQIYLLVMRSQIIERIISESMI